MANLKRKNTGRNYSDFHVHQLIIGRDFFHKGFGDDPDEDELRIAWMILKDRVMVSHAARMRRGLVNPSIPWGCKFDVE